MDRIVRVGVLLALAFGIAATGPAQGKPPLNPIRIAGEILAGGAGGFSGALVGSGIGNVFLTGNPFDPGTELMLGIAIGAPIGYTIGNAVGVYMVGNIGDETGSFLATLGCGILGSIIALPAAISIFNPDFGDTVLVLCVVASAATTSIGGTIGFNLSRRYELPSTHPGTALINSNDDQKSIKVNLLRVRF